VTVVKFSSSGANVGKETVAHSVKPDAEWKRQLSAISYEVARQAGTGRPYTGDSWDLHTAGLFRCVCCDTALFSSATKFFGDGLAQLLASPCEGERCRDQRYGFRHGANRDFLPSMRCSYRPRLRRWSPTNWLTLLHELCRHAFCEIRMNRRFVHNRPPKQ
jgi:hypothetical protein